MLIELIVKQGWKWRRQRGECTVNIMLTLHYCVPQISTNELISNRQDAFCLYFWFLVEEKLKIGAKSKRHCKKLYLLDLKL